MKTKILKLSLLTSILGIALWSCKKELNESNNPSQTKDFALQYNQNINPLEYVGVAHNIYMTKFTNAYNLSKQNGEWNNIEFLSNSYKTKFSEISNDAFREIYPESNSTTAKQEIIYNELNLNEWFDGDEVTPITVAEATLNNNNASQKDIEYTMNLLNDVFSSIKSATDDEAAYIALANTIQQHENLILSQEWEPSEEYALGALAVAKHSMNFWKNYDFSDYVIGANPRSSVIVGADVAGYVVGGVVGGTVGLSVGPITLGAGTVAGVLGGKAVGSWAASSAAMVAFGIYDAWVDFFWG